MPLEHERSSLELQLMKLRDLTSWRRPAAFETVRRASKAEVNHAWEKVRGITPTPGWELDCLQRVEVLPPAEPIECDRALVLVLGPGYEQMCEWLLETLLSFGDSPEVQIVIFCIDSAYENLQHVEQRVPNVTRIRCRSVEKITPAVKGVIYSLARWVKAKAVLSLECDMLITSSLQPLWMLIEQVQTPSVMGCTPNINPDQLEYEPQLLSTQTTPYDSPASDFEWITGSPRQDAYGWFNGGLLAGNHDGWRELDSLISSWMPFSAIWIEGFLPSFGDEIVMNLAVDQISDRVTLPPGWNVQSFTASRPIWFETTRTPHQVKYTHRNGQDACILHFAGGGRPLMRKVFYELALNAFALRKYNRQESLTV